MKQKILAFATLGCAVAIGASLAYAHVQSDRPDGVSADAWISLGPDAGFVVTRPPQREKLGLMGASAIGFFVARYNHEWSRLDAENTPQIVLTR
jgi:hypothetical protein